MSSVFGAIGSFIGAQMGNQQAFDQERYARKAYGEERDDNRENARMARDWAREDWEKAQRWARNDAAKLRQQNLDDYATVRADKLEDNAEQFVRSREAAEAGGFNPLTALGVPLANAGASGIATAAPVASNAAATPSIQGAVHQAGNFAPLASSQLIVDGIKELGAVISGEDANNQRIAKANAELADLRVDAARALVGVPSVTGAGYGGAKVTSDATTQYVPPAIVDGTQSQPIRGWFQRAEEAAKNALTAGPFQEAVPIEKGYDAYGRQGVRTGKTLAPHIEEELGTRELTVTPYGTREMIRGEDLSETASNFGKETYARFKNWEDKREHVKQQRALKDISKMSWSYVRKMPEGLTPLQRIRFKEGKVVTQLSTGKRFRKER